MPVRKCQQLDRKVRELCLILFICGLEHLLSSILNGGWTRHKINFGEKERVENSCFVGREKSQRELVSRQRFLSKERVTRDFFFPLLYLCCWAQFLSSLWSFGNKTQSLYLAWPFLFWCLEQKIVRNRDRFYNTKKVTRTNWENVVPKMSIHSSFHSSHLQSIWLRYMW